MPIFAQFMQDLCHSRKVREKHIDIFISFSYNMLKGNIPFNYVVQEECKLKLKKRVMPMLAGVLAAIATTITASAHPYDYWQGKYIGKDGANILLRIGNSAQTDLLNYDDVYKYGFEWNHISSKVNVSIAYNSPGMPSLNGEVSVSGKDLGSTIFGRIYPYDSKGNIMDDDSSANADWAYATIVMNTNPNAFNGASNKTVAARKTFLHEVGHLLKLCHPTVNSSLTDHTHYGYPYAIMNQGLPGGQTASSIRPHDKSCLIAKWGA